MPQRVTFERLVAQFSPGQTIFIPGSAAEPARLIEAMAADPERTRGVRLTTTFVPGINTLPIDPLDASIVVTSIFMQPGFTKAQSTGRFRHLPMCYSGFADHLRTSLSFDTCIVQVSRQTVMACVRLAPRWSLPRLRLRKAGRRSA